jgi:hypothetical protein
MQSPASAAIAAPRANALTGRHGNDIARLREWLRRGRDGRAGGRGTTGERAAGGRAAGNAASADTELGVSAGGGGVGSESHCRANVEPTARAPSRNTMAPVRHESVPPDPVSPLGGEVVIDVALRPLAVPVACSMHDFQICVDQY